MEVINSDMSLITLQAIIKYQHKKLSSLKRGVLAINHTYKLQNSTDHFCVDT